MRNGLDSFARNGMASGNGWRSSVRNGLDSFDRNGEASGNGVHFRDWMEFCLWRNPGKHFRGLYHSGWRNSMRNGMGSNGGPFWDTEEFPHNLYCSGLDGFAWNWMGANSGFHFWDWMGANTDFSFRDWMSSGSGFCFAWNWIVSGSGFWFWRTTGNRPFRPFCPSRAQQNVEQRLSRTEFQEERLSPLV